MNTLSSNKRVTKVPHWKKGAPLLSFSFELTESERKALRLSSMRMRGFKHNFQRDLETNITTVYGKNKKQILADIKALFPNLDVTVRRVFIPFGDA